MIVIHYHGIFQEGSSWDDGPGGVTQCSTAPGNFSMSQIKQERFGTSRIIVGLTTAIYISSYLT